MKIRKNALTAVIALLVITIIAAGFRFGMGMAVHSDDVCLLFTGKDWVNGKKIGGFRRAHLACQCLNNCWLLDYLGTMTVLFCCLQHLIMRR